MSSPSFLSEKSHDRYLRLVLTEAIQQTWKALRCGSRRIEISFPEARKTDISLVESLEVNNAFVQQMALAFTPDFGRDLWVLYPDKKEVDLVQSRLVLSQASPRYTISSIEAALAALSHISASSPIPKLIIAVNPGFNVNEWIFLSKIYELLEDRAVTMVVVNGQLQRLRSGYYPRLFYPELYLVNQRFYQLFDPGFVMTPVAVAGEAYGAYLIQRFDQPAGLWVRGVQGIYELCEQFTKERLPEPRDLWKLASEHYKRMRRIASSSS